MLLDVLSRKLPNMSVGGGVSIVLTLPRSIGANASRDGVELADEGLLSECHSISMGKKCFLVIRGRSKDSVRRLEGSKQTTKQRWGKATFLYGCGYLYEADPRLVSFAKINWAWLPCSIWMFLRRNEMPSHVVMKV